MNCPFSVFSVARFSGLMGAALLQSPSVGHAQGAALTDKLVGHVGGAVFLTQSVIRSKDRKASVLPYGFFDYGRFFARVDTLGFKTIKLGDGYLELAGRVSQDGWRADTAALAGLAERRTSIPLGLASFQKTPYGGIFLNAFVDANKSHGALLDVTYAAEFKLGNWSFYPQLGLEYRNAKYNDYFYGVSPAESGASGYAAYNAGASTTPLLGLAAGVPLGGHWVLNLQLRHKWLGPAVHNSPLVSRRARDTGFIAVSYHFK